MAELVWKGKQLPTGNDAPAYYLHMDQSYEANKRTGHQSEWQNCLIEGDQTHILPLLRRELSGAIDLIYIDPPFMTGRTFTSNGSGIAYRDTWKNDLDRYLQWLYETLYSLYALLAIDGSLYVHLDWRVVHYAKILLDELFSIPPQAKGAGFKNEIIWHYQSGGRARNYYARKHDTLLLYTKSSNYCFHSERVSQRRGTERRNHMRKEVGEDGRISWSIRVGGRVYLYTEDSPVAPTDVWSDISHLHQRDPERTGYATQKPEALLERIILASSEKDDLVLDCFCGSGVTPAVAEKHQRRWIACDKSALALQMTRERLLANDRHYPFVLQRCREAQEAKTPEDSGTTGL